MSMYICEICDGVYDGDYNVCTESTKTPYGLLCEDCQCDLEEEEELDEHGM